MAIITAHIRIECSEKQFSKILLWINKCSAVAEMGDRLATTDMGRKLEAVSLWGRGGGFPSKTMWPGLRPTSQRSGILNHPAVSPQQACAKNCRGHSAPLGEGSE